MPDAGKSFHYAREVAATTTRAHAHKIFKCICTSLARVLWGKKYIRKEQEWNV